MATKPTSTNQRVFFTKDDTALPLPNLMAHQKTSWREFVETMSMVDRTLREAGEMHVNPPMQAFTIRTPAPINAVRADARVAVFGMP